MVVEDPREAAVDNGLQNGHKDRSEVEKLLGCVLEGMKRSLSKEEDEEEEEESGLLWPSLGGGRGRPP